MHLLWQAAVMQEMSAVWQEVDHPIGATLEECFDVQVEMPGSLSYLQLLVLLLPLTC